MSTSLEKVGRLTAIECKLKLLKSYFLVIETVTQLSLLVKVRAVGEIAGKSFEVHQIFWKCR